MLRALSLGAGRKTQGRRGGPTAEAPQGGASLLAGLNYGRGGGGGPLSHRLPTAREEARQGSSLVAWQGCSVWGYRPRTLLGGSRGKGRRGKRKKANTYGNTFLRATATWGAIKSVVPCTLFPFFRARRGCIHSAKRGGRGSTKKPKASTARRNDLSKLHSFTS